MQKDLLEKLYEKKTKIPMLSAAGRVFEKQLMIDTIYAAKKYVKREIPPASQSHHTQSTKKKDVGFYSPFKTVSRDSRDSYLLRVTNEPNVKTNYEANHKILHQECPKYSLNRSQFERRIDFGYQIRDKSFEEAPVDSNTLRPRCRKSVDEGYNNRPLTVGDCMNWRKTFHQMDFNKQIDYKDKNQELNSTAYKTMDLTELNTKESHFNNLQRFSMKIKPEKAHGFDSDSPHKYLDLEQEEKVPVFDLEKTNWNRVKKRWDGNRANLKFDKYRNQIKTRFDRSEEAWNPKLQYNPHSESIKNKITKKIELNKSVSRQLNILPNKYPMKLTQRMDYGMSKYPQLQEQVQAKTMQNTIAL